MAGARAVLDCAPTGPTLAHQSVQTLRVCRNLMSSGTQCKLDSQSDDVFASAGPPPAWMLGNALGTPAHHDSKLNESKPKHDSAGAEGSLVNSVQQLVMTIQGTTADCRDSARNNCFKSLARQDHWPVKLRSAGHPWTAIQGSECGIPRTAVLL